MKTLRHSCYILLIIGLYNAASVNNIYAQKTHHLKKVTVTAKRTYKDSIKLETMVNLSQEAIAYKNNKPTNVEVVKFTLKITNGSSKVIPDPVKYKGAKFVKLYINGHPNNPKAFFDASEDITDKDNIIGPGQSQTFYCDWLRSSRTKLLRKYGRKFTVQFTYLKIRSPRYHVDLNNLSLPTP